MSNNRPSKSFRFSVKYSNIVCSTHSVKEIDNQTFFSSLGKKKPQINNSQNMKYLQVKHYAYYISVADGIPSIKYSKLKISG